MSWMETSFQTSVSLAGNRELLADGAFYFLAFDREVVWVLEPS
jgi:hypothetical protein